MNFYYNGVTRHGVDNVMCEHIKCERHSVNKVPNYHGGFTSSNANLKVQ
jgi:hypothetical protein